MIAVADALEIADVDVEVDEHQVARDIVRWALAVAGARRAERIVHLSVRLGPHPRLTPEEMEFTIRLLTRCTIAEGAEVEVRESTKPGVAVEQVVVR